MNKVFPTNSSNTIDYMNHNKVSPLFLLQQHWTTDTRKMSHQSKMKQQPFKEATNQSQVSEHTVHKDTTMPKPNNLTWCITPVMCVCERELCVTPTTTTTTRASQDSVCLTFSILSAFRLPLIRFTKLINVEHPGSLWAFNLIKFLVVYLDKDIDCKACLLTSWRKLKFWQWV